jgi:nucleoside 2-deoxyribosyltransferase
VIVQGGTYAVRVGWPNRYHRLDGSGSRAAQALTALSPTLVTAAEERDAADLRECLGAGAHIASRDRPVEFEYFTPLDRPTIIGGDALIDVPVQPAEDQIALTFGMIERDRIPTPVADTHVIDVQNPRNPSLEGLVPRKAREVFLSVNRLEATMLTGLSDADAAARQLLLEPKICGVIVKNGPLGAVVYRPDLRVFVGSRPTTTVWPIGSGDCFSAGVAGALSLGADLVEAARVGSISAALMCGPEFATIPAAVLHGQAYDDSRIDPALEAAEKAPIVYLAAPFFTLSERWLVEFVRSQLLAMGMRVFSPLHDVGKGGDEVAIADLEGLRGSDAVLALLDGWDPGTVYETGWAHRHGIPVVGLVSTTVNEEDKMLVGAGAEMHQQIASALYRTAWIAYGSVAHPGRYM